MQENRVFDQAHSNLQPTPSQSTIENHLYTERPPFQKYKKKAFFRTSDQRYPSPTQLLTTSYLPLFPRLGKPSKDGRPDAPWKFRNGAFSMGSAASVDSAPRTSARVVLEGLQAPAPNQGSKTNQLGKKTERDTLWAPVLQCFWKPMFWEGLPNSSSSDKQNISATQKQHKISYILVYTSLFQIC